MIGTDIMILIIVLFIPTLSHLSPFSIILSKVVYCATKYIFIEIFLIMGGLITTDFLIQLATIVGFSFIFALFYKGQPTA